MESTKKHELVLDFIESQGGRIIEHDITARKFNERALIIDDPERPDCVVFVMERHQPTAGATYTPGCPLSAFVRRQIRYVYNPKYKEIFELGDDAPPEFEMDYATHVEYLMIDVSFDFKLTADGKHLCRESLSHQETIVICEKDVSDFAEKVARGLDHTYDLEDSNNIEEDAEILEEETVIRYKRKAIESWNYYLRDLERNPI